MKLSGDTYLREYVAEKILQLLLAIGAATEEEVVGEPEAETEFEDNTYAGESRSVIIR